MSRTRCLVRARRQGGSIEITLPAPLRHALGWQEDDWMLVEIDPARGALIVRRWSDRRLTALAEHTP